jgi:hypothetical protein
VDVVKMWEDEDAKNGICFGLVYGVAIADEEDFVARDPG